MAVAKLLVIVAILLLQGAFSDAWGGYRDGLDYLSRCAREKRRQFIDDFAKELSKGSWRDVDLSSLIRQLHGKTDKEAEELISSILEKLDERHRKDVEELIRKKIREWKMTEPMRYVAYRGMWTRHEAEAKCKKAGKRLAVIRTPIEQTLAWEAVSARGLFNAYIGLHVKYEDYKKKYSWYDKTPLTYINVEPWATTRSSRCYVLSRNKGFWIMISCSAKFPVLCEYEPSNASSSTKTTSKPVTEKPSHNEANRYSGHIAPQLCRNEGRQMAVIRNFIDQLQVQAVAYTARSEYVHIGLYYYPDGRKRWIDNSKVTFSRFGVQAAVMPTTKRCYVMRVSTGYWFHVDCSLKYPVICQMVRQAAKTVPSRTYTTALPRTSSTTTSTTTTTAKPQSLVIDIRMNVEFQLAMADGQFKEKMKRSIAKALKIPSKYVLITGLRPGSTIVTTKIVLSAPETAHLTASKIQRDLRDALMTGELNINVFGKTVSPFADGVGMARPPEPDWDVDNDYKDEGSKRILFSVLIILLILLAIAITLFTIYWCVKNRKRQSVIPDASISYIQSTPVTLPEKCLPEDRRESLPPPPEKDAPPAYHECFNDVNT